MKTMAALGGRGQLLRTIALGLVVGACGGTTASSNGGESHFLRTCEGACGAGLECISGVCTRACVLGKDSCTDLATSAECTDQSIEPGAVVICDVGCSQDRDCSSLGDGYECQQGFCRGAALMTDASGGQGGSADATGGKRSSGGSANDGGSSNGNAGGAPGAGCRVLHQNYPVGTTGIPDSTGCYQCECQEGGLGCTLMHCGHSGPVFPCPESQITDPIDVSYYAIEGNELVLDVSYGGCGLHDFGICYEQSFRESSPVQGTLRLIHDQHDDACERNNTATLSFDLSPYANYYNEQYETDGGLISTNYGMYAFGTLTCDERTQAANAQVDSAFAQLDLGCESAADCERASNSTDCWYRCGAVIASSQAGRLTEALDAIDASLCFDFESDGCGPVLAPPCIPPGELACVDGQCTERGNLTCDERAEAAAAQVDSVLAQLDLGCESAADCKWAANATDCADRCSVLIAVSEEDRFTQALDDVNASVCAGYEEDGCTRTVPPCILPPALACIDGQCTEQRPDAGNGGAGGASNDGTGGTAGADGSCRLLHQTYPSGTRGIRDPEGCGTCDCKDGVLSCTLQACEEGAPVFPCPDDIVSDDSTITMDYYSIQGDRLVLDLRYGGGATMKHDFGVCYQEGFATSDPVQGTLRLLHDAHEDRYRGLISVTLSFDLGPYADHYSGVYETDGGLISTNYGLYAFGTLSCDERMQAANAQMDSLTAHLASGCSSAADCEWTTTLVGCAEYCGTLIVSSQADRYTQAVDDINTSVCGSYVEEGCPVAQPCTDTPRFDCVDGVCRELETP